MALLSVDLNGKSMTSLTERATTQRVGKLPFPKRLDAIPHDNDTGFIWRCHHHKFFSLYTLSTSIIMMAEPSKLLKASCKDGWYCCLCFGALKTVNGFFLCQLLSSDKTTVGRINLRVSRWEERGPMMVIPSRAEVDQGHSIQTGSKRPALLWSRLACLPCSYVSWRTISPQYPSCCQCCPSGSSMWT